MLSPKAQISLNYKKAQFKYFITSCNNSIKNEEYVKIQMSLEARENNILRIFFQCFTFNNLAMFMTFNDFNIEEDKDGKIIYDYIMEKHIENSKKYRMFHKENKIAIEFKLKKIDNKILSYCSFFLNFYEQGNTFEIEGNDIFVGDNHISLISEENKHIKPLYCGLDKFNIFENENKNIIVMDNPYNKVLLSVFEGYDTFDIYEIAKKFKGCDCTLVLNPFYEENVKIIKNGKNLLEKEPYSYIDTFFIKNQFKHKEVYATINLNLLEPFLNYKEDYNLRSRFNFIIPTIPSQRTPIIHRYCGGFYIFVQDARVQFKVSVEDIF